MKHISMYFYTAGFEHIICYLEPALILKNSFFCCDKVTSWWLTSVHYLGMVVKFLAKFKERNIYLGELCGCLKLIIKY